MNPAAPGTPNLFGRLIALLGLRSCRCMGRGCLSRMPRHGPVNILTREAFAAAIELKATVVLAIGNENPSLLSGLTSALLRAEVVVTS